MPDDLLSHAVQILLTADGDRSALSFGNATKQVPATARESAIVAWVCTELANRPTERLPRDQVWRAVVGRICVRSAVEAAIAGRGDDVVVGVLWGTPADGDSWPRYDVSTAEEREVLAPTLRRYLETLLSSTAPEDLLAVPRHRLETWEHIPKPEPPLHWDLMKALDRWGGAVLHAEVSESLRFGSWRADEWRNEVLQKAHPAVVYAFVADLDEAILGEYVSHPVLQVAAGALLRLASHGYQRSVPALREWRYKLAHRQSGAAEGCEEELERVREDLRTRELVMKRVADALADRVAKTPALVSTTIEIFNHIDRRWMVDMVVHLPAQVRDGFIGGRIRTAVSTGRWEVCNEIAEAASGTCHEVHDRVALACAEYWIDRPEKPRRTLIGLPLRLVVIGMVLRIRSVAGLANALREMQHRVLEQASGRYLSGGLEMMDDAALWSLAQAVDSRNRRDNGEIGSGLLEQTNWLSEALPFAHATPTSIIGLLATNLVAGLDTDRPEDLEAAVRLLSIALDTEHFAHAWAGWLPPESAHRRRLLHCAHESIHARSRLLVATISPRSPAAVAVCSAMLETRCPSCRRLALNHLNNTGGNPIAALSRAILRHDSSASSRHVRQLFGWPLIDSGLSRLRDALALAAEDEIAGYSIGDVVDDLAPIRDMEAMGLVDGSAILWSMREAD